MEGVNANKIPLGHYFAIAAAYAACYEVVRHFSFSHWMLTAGLRLACLLLIPRRFWPALVIGEALPLIEKAALCAPSLGIAWAMVSSVPFICLCMPVVALVLRRMNLYDSAGQLKMSSILTATLGCALVTALRVNAAVFAAYIVRPDGIHAWMAEAIPDFMADLLGCYLGALTLTPVILALREIISQRTVNLRDMVYHPLLRDTFFIVAPCLAVLTMVARIENHVISEYARLALVLPVVVATARHGWQGGAISGMLASIGMACTATVLLDPTMIRAQVVLSLTISGALVAGVRIAQQRTLRTPNPY